jgi:hypothetical protein
VHVTHETQFTELIHEETDAGARGVSPHIKILEDPMDPCLEGRPARTMLLSALLQFRSHIFYVSL